MRWWDDRLDQRRTGAEAVVGDRFTCQRIVESRSLLGDLGFASQRHRWVMGGNKQLDQRSRGAGCAAQRVNHRDQSERASSLPQVAEPGAQPLHGLRVEADEQRQLVEFIVFRGAAEHAGNGVLDLAAPSDDRFEICFAADLQAEIMNDPRVPHQRGRHFRVRTEILEYRHRVGRGRAPCVRLEVQMTGGSSSEANANAALAVALDRA